VLSRSTWNDPAGQTGDAFDLGEVVGEEVLVTGGVDLRALAELLPEIRGLLQQREFQAGVKGRDRGAVF